MRTMWRCRTCFYRSPRAYCYTCEHTIARVMSTRDLARESTCDCGYASNVPRLVAAHQRARHPPK